MPKRCKTWTVQFTIVDSPDYGEKFMTQKQLKDEIFRYGCTSAGVKIGRTTFKEVVNVK